MKQWPHAPIHIFDEAGTFMVTAGTYKKQHYFNAPESRELLQDTLLSTAAEFDWNLQAWAVFSNYYHFLAVSPTQPENIRDFISKLHAATSRAVNKMDNKPSRKVWFQFWDNRITFQNSYYARLNYVHNNPVRHGLVKDAMGYHWCSAAWFARTADAAFYKTVSGFKTDQIKIPDDF